MSLLFGESHELRCPEHDFVRVKGEQGFGGPILEGCDDFGHGVEHANRHRPRHGGDDGLGDFHDDEWWVAKQKSRHVSPDGEMHGGSDEIGCELQDAEQEQQVQHEGGKEKNGENNAKQDHIDLHVIHAARGVGIKFLGKPLQRVRAEVEHRMPGAVVFVVKHGEGLSVVGAQACLPNTPTQRRKPP